MYCLDEMKVKKIHRTFLIILVIMVVILTFYFSTISNSSELSVLDSNLNEIHTTILKTSINEISENGETITYRFKWLSETTDSTCDSKKYFSLKFSISDYEKLRDKPRLPDNVPNQFGVESELILTGLKAYQYPCEDNQKIISIKNLIKKQSIRCSLVSVEGKPIISCGVEIMFKSEVPVNYYGNVDGYTDITFKKEVNK